MARECDVGVVLAYCAPYLFSLLASGSDDLDIILWDPLTQRLMTKIQTGHSGNIFSVKVRNKFCTFLLHTFLNSSYRPLVILHCLRVPKTMRFVTTMLLLPKRLLSGRVVPAG